MSKIDLLKQIYRPNLRLFGTLLEVVNASDRCKHQHKVRAKFLKLHCGTRHFIRSGIIKIQLSNQFAFSLSRVWRSSAVCEYFNRSDRTATATLLTQQGTLYCSKAVTNSAYSSNNCMMAWYRCRSQASIKSLDTPCFRYNLAKVTTAPQAFNLQPILTTQPRSLRSSSNRKPCRGQVMCCNNDYSLIIILSLMLDLVLSPDRLNTESNARLANRVVHYCLITTSELT